MKLVKLSRSRRLLVSVLGIPVMYIIDRWVLRAMTNEKGRDYVMESATMDKVLADIKNMYINPRPLPSV